MRRRQTLTAASVVVLSLATSPARGQRVVPPDSPPPGYLALSQFQHDRWTRADGLPNDAIDWIARSPDGYLWLGTEGGLVRFDGVRFNAFDRRNTPALRGTDFSHTIPLHVDRQGVLWIGTSGGLVRYQNGKFAHVATAGQPSPLVTRMVEDAAGHLWAWLEATDSQLYEVRDGRLMPVNPESGLPARVSAVAAEPGGALWVATVDRGLLRVSDGRAVVALPNDAIQSGVTTLLVARDGVLWVGTQSGFGRFLDGRFEFHRLGAAGLEGYVSAFAEDAAGDVWLGTVGMGVLRYHAGRLERFDRRDGLSRDYVVSLLIDREGSIWVSTRGGLDRFRRGAVATFTPRNGGPPFVDPGPLLLNRRGHFVVAGATSGLVAGRPGSWAPLPVALTQKVWTLAQGRAGIWVGADTVTLYRTGAAPRMYTARDGLIGKWMLAVAEDSLERVWVGTNEGLFCLRPGFRSFTKMAGLPHSYVRALVVDRQGGVWAGTNGGVARIAGDSVQSWRPADGLAGPVVFAIREIDDGSIWIGTSGGLTRVRDGSLVPIRAEQGLPGEMVIAIEEAGGDLWIVTGSGISRIPLSELDAVADGRAQRVRPTTFGTGDGLPATEVVAGAQPLSVRTPDGRLWFSTAGGLAVVDPRELPQNPIVPAVHIEDVSADGVRLSREAGATTPLRVPARTGRLTLNYTATSLLLPDRVRFRYQLVGYDRAWVDATSAERAVSYTGLGPGRYTFRVVAANDSGVWNEAGASLDLSIAPAYHQTTWFRLAVVVTILAMVVASYQFRLRRIAHDFNMRLDERVNERTRIARELHDTLLQTFHGLLFRFQAANNMLPDRPVEARQKFESAIDQAAQALTEGRDAVQNLRSAGVDTTDLAVAITTLSEELSAADTEDIGAKPVVSVAVTGTRRDLHPLLRDDIYRIAGEALRNAFRHSQARHIEVEVRYDDKQLQLRVRDDGNGIDVKVLEERKVGHFGLPGMRERAELIGGHLDVWSQAGIGTEVDLKVPAYAAYAAPRSRSRVWPFAARMGPPS